jgi:hypothetical protein
MRSRAFRIDSNASLAILQIKATFASVIFKTKNYLILRVFDEGASDTEVLQHSRRREDFSGIKP